MPKATSLNDFVEKRPLVFSKEHIREGVEKFVKVFGSFNRTGLHKFYEQAGIAQIQWERKMEDGSLQAIKDGRINAVMSENITKGSKAWKNYEAQTDCAFDFWEEFYRQAHTYISQKEWGEKQALLELQSMADESGVM